MDVAIVGLGMHPFGRTPTMSGLEQGAAAVREALADAGTDFKRMEFAFGGSQDSGNADSLVNLLGPDRATVHQRGKWLCDGR
jgi:acetyl-CoA acetyltransferase